MLLFFSSSDFEMYDICGTYELQNTSINHDDGQSSENIPESAVPTSEHNAGKYQCISKAE